MKVVPHPHDPDLLVIDTEDGHRRTLSHDEARELVRLLNDHLETTGTLTQGEADGLARELLGRDTWERAAAEATPEERATGEAIAARQDRERSGGAG